MENIHQYLLYLKELALEFSPRLLLAIVVLLLGWWVVTILTHTLQRFMQKKKVDPSLHPFLKSVTGIALKVLLLISVAAMVGIETTSFIAVLGAATLAIGLALQGSLANFAGGILILLLRPFEVDDFIEVQEHAGTVQSIRIFYTIIKTPQNQVIALPNASVSNTSIINYTAEETRRLDLVFGIGYDDDIDEAKQSLYNIVEHEERILKEPAPAIVVDSLGDNSVNFKLKVWTQTSEYWDVYYTLQETVKKKFDQIGISIPFPQRDIRLLKEEEN